ncbi:MAG TPA: multicopper oxidase domain-containing protein, partial [Terrimesophilobacter sp.]|nr:multicopper oxidase domain-containing protein [Terrimesophilobacter sp.]
VRALVAVGAALYVAGLIIIGVAGWHQARQAPPTTFASWSMAAAYAWFVGCTVAFGVLLTIAPTWADAAGSVQALITPFAGGFAAQIVIGALSYLLPVVLGGGPEVSRRTAAPLERGGLFRVLVVNAGGLIYVLPVPSLVRVVVSLVIFAVLVSFLWFAAQSILAVREPKAAKAEVEKVGAEKAGAEKAGAQKAGAEKAGAVASGKARKPKPEKPVRERTTAGAVTAAATVLVLAVTSGVMLDPASAGIGSVHADEGAATGNTTIVDVVMRDTRFLPDVIEVPVGDLLVINLINEDNMDHDLTVENGFTSGRIHAGETVMVEVGLITSTLDAWCSIAGHRLLGMVMTIVAVGSDGEPHVGASSPPESAGHEGHEGHGAQTGEPGVVYDPMAPGEPGFEAMDATLPPASGDIHRHTFVVQEAVREVAPGITQRLWTFGGTAPGPTLRGKVGDRFEITLVNDGTVGHSIDFHAGALAPDEPMRTIQPGESLTYNFTATRSGIWMYHCATMPMSLHIANGMFGAVIIDPPGLPEVDREFLLVQSEFYLGPQGGEPTMERIITQHPDMVAFNGYGNQYVYDPLEARVGETVRVWVLDVGPNRPSSFHVVGGQFDTVFFEGDYLLRDGGSTGTGGSQALALQAAQGGFVELVFPEAGHYPFVSHIMSDAEKGASGTFRITD